MSKLGIARRLSCLALAAVMFTACGDEDKPDGGGTTDTGGGDPDAGPGMDVPPSGDTGPQDTGPRMDAMPTDTGPTGPREIIFLHTNDEHSHELGFAPE